MLVALTVSKENISYVSMVNIGSTVFVISLWVLTTRSIVRGPPEDLEQIPSRFAESVKWHFMDSDLHGVGQEDLSDMDVRPSKIGEIEQVYGV